MKTRTVFPLTGIKFFAVIVTMFCSILWAGIGISAENKGPCADDVATFCKDVQPGGGAIAQCLKEHADELSPACKKYLAAAKQKVQVFIDACKDDMSKFCKHVKAGGGRILKCLKEHENELSPECKAKMTSAK